MLTKERQTIIRDRLARDGKVVAIDLAAEFAVSEDTIRRDLRDLAKAGLCERVYGGALAPAPDLGSFAQRETVDADEKDRLGRAAAALVTAGQTVFIDAGTTNLAVARHLPRSIALTVATNVPAVALALAAHDRARVVLVGGNFDTAKGACLGAEAMISAQQITPDVLFLGPCGINADAVSALDPEEAALKRVLIANSRRIVVVATADKLGTTAPFRLAPVAALDTVVLDADAAPQLAERLAGQGVSVVSA